MCLAKLWFLSLRHLACPRGVPILSMSAAQLPCIKWLIRALRADAMRALYAQASQLDDAEQVRQLTSDYLLTLNYPGISRPAKATP